MEDKKEEEKEVEEEVEEEFEDLSYKKTISAFYLKCPE